jgi:hypothetical protein
MQFEVHEDPEVTFIPRVGSLIAAQVIEGNDTTKVPAISAVNITMKEEGWSKSLYIFS